jgi:hypothetical protein
VQDGAPIQVKHRTKVPRAVVDSFETAIERSGAKHGYLVAFGFTEGARSEAARMTESGRMRIELITASELATRLRKARPPSSRL